jgi:hypothetical protein
MYSVRQEEPLHYQFYWFSDKEGRFRYASSFQRVSAQIVLWTNIISLKQYLNLLFCMDVKFDFSHNVRT